MNEEAVGEDEDEYDEYDRAEIQKMELVLLLEKIKADLGGQEDILLTQMLTKNVKMTLKSIGN